MKSLADDLQVAPDTVKHWLDLLVALHVGVHIRPWFTNVTKSLRKEPKWFLRDWSGIEDPGKCAETFVACHLLKAGEGWSDMGLGTFELRYLRVKQQREVDFVVIRDRKPWFLVEVKAGKDSLSPSLKYYQDQITAPHAFQVDFFQYHNLVALFSDSLSGCRRLHTGAGEQTEGDDDAGVSTDASQTPTKERRCCAPHRFRWYLRNLKADAGDQGLVVGQDQ